LDNDWAILWPVVKKLFEQPPFEPDFGSILVLIAELRSASRLPIWLARRVRFAAMLRTTFLNQRK